MHSLALAIAKPNPSPVPQGITDLASKSLDIGYKVLAERVQRVNAFHEGTILLRSIDINVYDDKSVQRYKRLAFLKAKYLVHAKYLLYAIILLPVMYVCAIMIKNPRGPASLQAVIFGLSSISALCAAIVSIVAYIVNTFSRHKSLEWRTRSMGSYDKPIPEDILRTAISIREALPKSEICVEELVTVKRVVDPFLYVIYKDVRLYVAVWDEPKFDGKML